MDKERLSQLRPLRRELEMIDEKLNKLYDRQANIPIIMGKVVGSSKDFPYTEVRTSVLMNEPNESDEIDKQIRIKENQKSKVEKLITEIEQFIAEIPDSIDRQIFELRYIDGMKQREIANRVGLERSSISKRIDAVLKLSHNSQK